MNSNDYDFEDEGFEDNGRQQLEEYEMYVREQNAKANALLTHVVARVVAHNIAEELAGLVRLHGMDNGRTNLLEMLRNTVAENLIIEVMRERQNILRQPVNLAGYIAIRKALDAACAFFEFVLSAEEISLPVERDAK